MRNLKDKWIHHLVLGTTRVYAYSALFLGASIALIVYFTSGPKVEEILSARKSFEAWTLNPRDPTLTKNMKKAIGKVPGLEKAWQGDIVQRLIAEGASQETKEIAPKCIERLREEAPLHAAFAEGTFFIEENHFQRALELSVSLKEQMDRSGDRLVKEHGALYACNLLRIAFLQKQLRNEAGELAAWEEIRALKEGAPFSGVSKFWDAHFKQQAFSLNDFISQREQSIAGS
jgi:hypothetical protein